MEKQLPQIDKYFRSFIIEQIQPYLLTEHVMWKTFKLWTQNGAFPVMEFAFSPSQGKQW